MDICRSNRFVRTLRICLGLEEIWLLGIESFAIFRENKILRRRTSLIAHIDGVRSHVSDKAAFIKPLRKLHRLARRHPKNARSGLLES